MSLIIFLAFMLDKLSSLCTADGNGIVSKLLKAMCCCLHFHDTNLRAFSCNILNELSPEALKNEYASSDLQRVKKQKEADQLQKSDPSN
jgi:hypothetical protein